MLRKMTEEKVKKVHRTRLLPLDKCGYYGRLEGGYGFGIKHEMQFSDSKNWFDEGTAHIKIEEDDDFADRPMILLTGTDSGGYDSCWIPVDAPMARTIAELLMKLANDLESGAWKK